MFENQRKTGAARLADMAFLAADPKLTLAIGQSYLNMVQLKEVVK